MAGVEVTSAMKAAGAKALQECGYMDAESLAAEIFKAMDKEAASPKSMLERMKFWG